MCEICDAYDKHMKVVKEAAAKIPELKDGLLELIRFLEIERNGSMEGPDGKIVPLKSPHGNAER